MKTIGKGQLEWPETEDEKRRWVSTDFHRTVTSSRVMAVANQRIEGTWCAYIDSVPGIHHDKEWFEVLRTGDKMGEKLALFLFPMFEGVPYAW